MGMNNSYENLINNKSISVTAGGYKIFTGVNVLCNSSDELWNIYTPQIPVNMKFWGG